MWVVDPTKKVVHDMSHPQHECQISKIPKETRKKIYTETGMKLFLNDPMNKGFSGCRFCMPEYCDFDMTSIYQNH